MNTLLVKLSDHEFYHVSITYRIIHDKTDALVFPREAFNPRSCLEEGIAHVGTRDGAAELLQRRTEQKRELIFA